MIQSKQNRLIGRPFLIIICAFVIMILIGLPRLNMMLRLEESGIINFNTRDYVRRLIVTFLSSALILSFNLYMNRIKWGKLIISFSSMGHLIGTNLLLFAAIQFFIYFKFASQVQIDAVDRPGNLYLWPVALNASILIVCILIAVAYRSIKEKYLVTLENEALLKETAKAKFAQLREQINPHFMFNSFSTLNGLIEESAGRAKNFLMNMSDIYRYVLKSENATTVSLEEELHFARVYAAMIDERFNDGIQFAFQIENDQLQKRVVPLSVQMLIENTVKHNHFNRSSPLKVVIKIEADRLEVTNNLQKRVNIENNHSIGLHNLNQRYKYASKQEIIIKQTATEFSVKIPLLK